MSYESENISLVRASKNVDGFISGEINKFESLAFANLFYPYLMDNGGSDSIVSLTIDILNKDELNGKKFPNEKWHDIHRQKGSLVNTEPIWGFKETSHASKISPSIGNAFCFADQQLTFYIANEGQGIGYIDDQWLYLRQNLTVSALNVLTGQTSILKQFNGFDTDADDSSRYFTWTVPSQDLSAFYNYGLLGMFVIRVDIDNEYFLDATLEKPYVGDYPNKNLALLHLTTYSAAKELDDVTEGGIEILKSAIASFENLEDIFDSTIFSDFESLNLNDLTTDQKRAIVADQIAVVFMSQHPVVTADHYPSKIIGYGMTQSAGTETVINKAASYAQRYPNVYSLARDRLFGMVTTVEKFNFASELFELFPNYQQSLQSIREPSRIILTDANNKLSDDLGVEGILFNPYVMETVGSEIVFDVSTQNENIYEISLTQGSIDIDNITFTNEHGQPIENNENDIMVSFRVLVGETRINRIRGVLWSKNNLNHMEWVDNTGTKRQHVFEFHGLGKIVTDLEMESESEESPWISGEGDIVYLRLDVEDIEGIVHTFYGEKLIPSTEEFPGITVVGALQRQDGSGMVDLYYDYFGRSEINTSFVKVEISTDGVTFSDLNTNHLRGDLGEYVMPGRNHIVWYPYQTYSSNYPSSVILRLFVFDADRYANVGLTSNIAILDLEAPEIAVRKVNVEEESEMFKSSSSSISSSSSSSSIEYSSSSSSLDSSSSSLDSSSSS